MNTTNNRLYGLDILRAIAIIAVVHGHGYGLVAEYVKAAPYGLFLDLDGVSLFFVLSGFLIGTILIGAITSPDFNMRSLVNFWTRRWFRTLPNYYLVLGGYLVFFYFKNGAWVNVSHLLLTFTQGLFGPPPYFFSEAWSLAVEEWFYLLVPAILYVAIALFGMQPRRALVACMVLVIVACTGFRVARAIELNYFAAIDPMTWGYNMAMPVAGRLDAIMYGVIGAYIAKFRPDIFKGRENKFFVIGVILLIFAPRAFFLGYVGLGKIYQNLFYFPVLSVGALLLLPKLLSVRNGTGPVYRSVTFISKISYSMYLLNLTVVEVNVLPAILNATGLASVKTWWASTLSLGLFWLVTIGLSYLLYRFWEQPVMRLRDKFSISAPHAMKGAPATVPSN